MGKGESRGLVGGQAVIEGVMMRSGKSLAVAVRRAGGEVVVKKDCLRLVTDRLPLLRRPLLRGVPALYYSLLLGVRALNFSAAQAMEEENESGGGWLVSLTTRRPDDSQIEVAVEALRAVLDMEGGRSSA